MKKILIFCMGIVMLSFFSCEKENLEEMAQNPRLESRYSTPPPPPNLPCATSFMIHGMTPSSATCVVYDLSGQLFATLGNGTGSATLETNTGYLVRIPLTSASASLSWCSCGDNLGSGTIPAGGFYYIHTSSDPSYYTICTF